MGIINSNFMSVGTLLQSKIYHIPIYQRGYSWAEEQLEDLWIDLTQLNESLDIENHFFGQIVVHKDRIDQKYYIIDGQQRTSTSIILLNSLRKILDSIANIYENEDAKIDADDITSQYIGRYTNKRKAQRLFLGDEDREFFSSYIQNRDKKNLTKSKIKSLTNSEKLIYEASIFFDKKLDEFANSYQDSESKYNEVKKLLDTFIKNFNVMYIETDDVNEAFIIFETLNARGKDLETSDLLKNHVLRSSSSKIEIVKIQWDQMIENLTNIDPTKFIRHYWNSQYKFIREKDLYKNLRYKMVTPKAIEQLLKDLVKLSELYSSLYQPSVNIYYKNTELNERLQDLNKLGARSYYPIMLALEKESFNEENINLTLKALECLITRNLVVAGKVANKYEIEFSRIAYEISEHKLYNIQDIVESIRKLTINDLEFNDDFKIFTTKKTPVIRYLLRKIHNYSNVETRIIDDNNIIHVEHIMPKSISKWDVTKELHEEFLWKLGNLTLLGQEYNRSAANNTFAKKKEVYKKSNIPMTKNLSKILQWDISKISKRQEDLAKTALLVWPK